jgi:hypothetical protein
MRDQILIESRSLRLVAEAMTEECHIHSGVAVLAVVYRFCSRQILWAEGEEEDEHCWASAVMGAAEAPEGVEGPVAAAVQELVEAVVSGVSGVSRQPGVLLQRRRTEQRAALSG